MLAPIGRLIQDDQMDMVVDILFVLCYFTA